MNALKNKEYKICSECSATSHTWKDCTAIGKRCIICNGNHRTLAMKCPERKKAIERKRKQNRDKRAQKQSYSKATQAGGFRPSNPNSKIESQTPTKILTAMILAHLLNIADPSYYENI